MWYIESVNKIAIIKCKRKVILLEKIAEKIKRFFQMKSWMK